MNITQADLDRYYKDSKRYQEDHFDEIADAIRYVDGTTKDNDMIYAVNFAERIRRMKGSGGGGGGGEWTGSCCFGDNIPTGCGEVHGLLHLDYKLVNCVTARVKDPSEALGNGCLCEDNFAYGPPACKGLYGLKHLDYTLVNTVFNHQTLWGWNPDAS